jgi:thiol-disulfide isomerase/thioredoxin/ribosomal protein S8
MRMLACIIESFAEKVLKEKEDYVQDFFSRSGYSRPMLKPNFPFALTLTALALTLPGRAQQVIYQKASPEQQKAMKLQKEKLLQDLKLSPDQRQRWLAIELDYKAKRQPLIEQVTTNGADASSVFAKLTALRAEEEAAKEAILTPEQRMLYTKLPKPGMPSQGALSAGATIGSDVAKSVKATTLENNTPAPDLTLRDANGKSVRLSNFRGKVVVLDFWATWCKPCLMALPGLNALAKKNPDVVFLTVNVQDTPAAFQAWRAKNTTLSSLRLMSDPAGVSTMAYKIQGLPTQYVIGRDGRIAASSVGYSGSDAALEQMIQNALKK